jgi:hypothetical protein
MKAAFLHFAALFLTLGIGEAAPLAGWTHSGEFTVLTTPDGARLPTGAVVEEFPVLVRLHRDWFDFSQAKPDGADVRFTDAAGKALALQVEDWDAVRGEASVWVRVPRIEGNARQTLAMHWGKADAASASDGKAVFNESNGYLSVWHLGDTVRDEVGTLESKDTGTSLTNGIIGRARHFPGKAGVFGGDKIANYPTGASAHSSEVWFRTRTANSTLIGWGNEQAQGKVVMQLRSPPHVGMDCYFSSGNVAGSRLPLGDWTHVVHTYRQGESVLYVNGQPVGTNSSKGSPLNIRTPARLWLGGWYNNYNFVGEMDEVRSSNVTRSADWVRLQFENQKPQQTLVGPLVQPGNAFSVSVEKAVVEEGKSAAFTAQAGGAQKVFWLLQRDGREEVVATDRFKFTFAAGRVTGDAAARLRFKAVFPDGVKTKDIAIAVKEVIPEPVFTLKAPAAWDGRATIEVVAQVANLAAMQARGAGELKFEWSAGPLAVIKEVAPGKLRLLRAQNSGPLTVTATVNNGGKPTTRSVTLAVTEPKRDAWVARVPARDEQPEDGQFFARDDSGTGTLHYNGTLTEPADAVFLRLFADDKLVKTETAKPGADRSFVLSAKLKPGLIRYRVEFGTRAGGQETVLRRVGDLVCGDAFLIDGQSNALATDTGEKSPPETSEWIRSYGGPTGRADGAAWLRDRQKTTGLARPNLWCRPVWKRSAPEHQAELGWWGMELAKRLVTSNQMPVCIIQAAIGGSRIDEHQASPADHGDLSTMYGRMLWRVREARLTHGIRGILWHQGENDQGADGPTGGFGWESYHRLFSEMAGAWKQDFPNVQHYYVFQIWPNSCAMGGSDGAGDRLREQQRTLPQLFSKMSILSTLGVRPPGGCHYPLAGWGEFARMAQPLIERDVYGKAATAPLTAPNLRRVAYTTAANDTLALEFDQPVKWNDALATQFYLDGAKDKIASGSIAGNVLTLKLKEPLAAKQITYLKEVAWSQDTLLIGANGLAALTFCEVPLASHSTP